MQKERFQKEKDKVSFVRVIPSQANFFMIELTGRYTSNELSSVLLKRFNILIKSCNTKHGLENKNYIRIAVRNRIDNDRLLDALKSL